MEPSKCKKGFKIRDGKCTRVKGSPIMNFIPTRFPPLIAYIVGAFLEAVGFGLLFAFDKTMLIIHKFPIIFSLLIIFSGYVIAIGAREKR